MIAAAHQPIFLPWPGFFFKAMRADILILLDEVQFPQGRSWMTRNRVKSSTGELWLTVPVRKKHGPKHVIRETELVYDSRWPQSHMRSLALQYPNAPYLEDYLPSLESIYTRRPRCLAELNIALIRILLEALGTNGGKLVLQSQLNIEAKGTDLLVALANRVGADAYLSLRSAEKYLDLSAFESQSIKVITADFRPPIYPQLWGNFIYNLSVIDLLFNCGPRSADIILGKDRRS